MQTEPLQPQLVTTDMLVANPQTYMETPVILDNVTITGTSFLMIDVRSDNASTQESIAVFFADWPSELVPVFEIGQHVTLSGIFIRLRVPPGAPPIYNLVVKFGTQNYVRLNP